MNIPLVNYDKGEFTDSPIPGCVLSYNSRGIRGVASGQKGCGLRPGCRVECGVAGTGEYCFSGEGGRLAKVEECGDGKHAFTFMQEQSDGARFKFLEAQMLVFARLCRVRDT